jgi:hypothetical protein
MPRMRTAPVILTLFVVASANATSDARAEDCLSGPNGPSPAGKHWFYRVDRAAHRHCWYLGALGERRHRIASARPAASASRRAEPMPPEPAAEPAAPAAAPAPPAAAAPPPDAAAPPPQPAFGTRWPDDAPSVVADGAQPQPQAAAPVAAASPPPDRMATRQVPVERITREAPPPKPPEPVTVRLAAAPPAAASPPAPAAETHSGLPAALFGVALLLAVLGTILVRARRRFIVRVTETPAMDSPPLAPGRDEHVRKLFMRIRRPRRSAVAKARSADEQRPARRSLHQILADAASDEQSPDDAFLAQAVGSAAAADITAATLQPAIDPLPPEPIAPAPDVEQSLRQLLANWERRAA